MCLLPSVFSYPPSVILWPHLRHSMYPYDGKEEDASLPSVRTHRCPLWERGRIFSPCGPCSRVKKTFESLGVTQPTFSHYMRQIAVTQVHATEVVLYKRIHKLIQTIFSVFSLLPPSFPLTALPTPPPPSFRDSRSRLGRDIRHKKQTNAGFD